MNSTQRLDAAQAGARAAFPLAVPAMPFGLVLGYAITQGPLDPLTGWSSSWIVYAGASQLAAVNLFAERASALVILGTVFIINSRHFLYAAALNERVRSAPGWFRSVAGYMLIDQIFAIIDSQPHDIPRTRLMWLWLGAGGLFWTIWQASVAAGVLLGDLLPTSWSLGFVVPLLFGGLMVLSIRNQASVLAAVVGALVAVAGSGLPQGSGLIVAIVAGVTAAALAEQYLGVADA